MPTERPRHPNTVHLLRLFAYNHLPGYLQSVSKPCADVAFDNAARLPDGPELSFALRQLSIAQSAFVQAAVLQREDQKAHPQAS